MLTKLTKKQLRNKRLPRIRAKLKGSKAVPRFTVYKSNYALYAQLVDDTTGNVLLSASEGGKNRTHAQKLGKAIAELAKKKGIKSAVFDRSGYRYHGIIEVIVNTAREGGLVI
jgi:large subunit ribosomal protein L18